MRNCFMHPKLLRVGERVGVLGSCCYGQLSKADFQQGPLSFESQCWGPPGDLAEVSAQRRCCPHFPASFTQKGLQQGACSPTQTCGIRPSHTCQFNIPHCYLAGDAFTSCITSQSLSCLRFVIDPQNDATPDLGYCESEELMRFTTIQKLLL